MVSPLFSYRGEDIITYGILGVYPSNRTYIRLHAVVCGRLNERNISPKYQTFRQRRFPCQLN
jgi:hypothetical protein